MSDLALFVVMYLITALGVEAGLHRYFTHRSFEASEPVRVFLAIAGSMAAQGPVVFWVANHRLHHAFADTDRDPHSPQPQGPGWWGRAKGLWHGHVGWLFDVKKIDWSRHTRDWLADRRVMKINAWYFWLVVLGIVVPGVVGGLVTQSLHGVVGGILWGGFARIFALDQATWAVNSLGHTIGARDSRFGTEAAISAPWHRPRWVGHGTTTTTPGRRWPRPVGTGGSSIWPETSSGCSTGSGLAHHVRYVNSQSDHAAGGP